MFRRMSIRNLLILFTSAILLVPTLTLGISSYWTAQGKVKQLMQNDAQRSNHLLNDIIEQILQPKIEAVNYFVKELNPDDYSVKNAQAFQTRIETFLSIHTGISATYIGTSDGRTYQTPGEVPKGYDPRTRPWYQDAMNAKGKVIITEPYEEVSSKNIIVSICLATEDGSGVFGVDVSLKDLAEVVNNMNTNATTQTMILTADRHIIMHPSIKAGEEAGNFADSMSEKPEGNYTYSIDNDSKDIFYITNPLTGWKVGRITSVSQYNKEASSIFKAMIIILLVTLLLGTLANLSIVAMITKPIRILVNAVGAFSKGDLRERVTNRSHNEIGQLANAFNEMASSMNGLIREVSETTMQLAATSEQMSSTSEQTSAAAKQVAESIGHVAEGARIQKQATSESARAVEEMSEGIQRVAESSSHVAERSVKTGDFAEEGNKSLERMVDQMNAIDSAVMISDAAFQKFRERSEQIRQIVDVISEIAAQTNLLSLNASIEAARAGEGGRGFAVVANEVKKLAERSAASAGQITYLIEEVQQDTVATSDSFETVKQNVKSGIEITHETEVIFAAIRSSMTEVSGQIQEITAVVEEMNASSEEVTASVVQMTAVSERSSLEADRVAKSSEEQLHAVREISESSRELAQMAERLQTLIERFKV